MHSLSLQLLRVFLGKPIMYAKSHENSCLKDKWIWSFLNMIFRDIVGSERKEAGKYFSKTNGKGLSKHCVSTARSFLSERLSVYSVTLPFNFERQIW